mmetsp:Transcript_54053/g.167766  ORF Transcript_54053/g.167766 Transcript_54053/m.167766 type:complete len:272 (-) Transcript_54053:940-1755(-)
MASTKLMKVARSTVGRSVPCWWADHNVHAWPELILGCTTRNALQKLSWSREGPKRLAYFRKTAAQSARRRSPSCSSASDEATEWRLWSVTPALATSNTAAKSLRLKQSSWLKQPSLRGSVCGTESGTWWMEGQAFGALAPGRGPSRSRARCETSNDVPRALSGLSKTSRVVPTTACWTASATRRSSIGTRCLSNCCSTCATSLSTTPLPSSSPVLTGTPVASSSACLAGPSLAGAGGACGGFSARARISRTESARPETASRTWSISFSSDC